MRWRLLLSPPMNGPWNMALDHALMAHARASGDAVLRVYSWSEPVLSLGRNQRAREVYLGAELARRGISVVRRPTGGRGLLHHREVTYSVTAPASDEPLWITYDRINRLLIHALGTLGVRAEVAEPRVRSPLPGPTPCFAEPSRGEIIAGGRKLVGSAQWRDEGALLQHGSIIVDDDQSTIPQLMRAPTAAPAPAQLRQLLGRAPAPGEVADALFSAVRSCEDAGASILEANVLSSLQTEPLLSLYRDVGWTWRR